MLTTEVKDNANYFKIYFWALIGVFYIVGVLACLDGYMNIALEQTEEYVDGQVGIGFVTRPSSYTYHKEQEEPSFLDTSISTVLTAMTDVAVCHCQHLV